MLSSVVKVRSPPCQTARGRDARKPPAPPQTPSMTGLMPRASITLFKFWRNLCLNGTESVKKGLIASLSPGCGEKLSKVTLAAMKRTTFCGSTWPISLRPTISPGASKSSAASPNTNFFARGRKKNHQDSDKTRDQTSIVEDAPVTSASPTKIPAYPPAVPAAVQVRSACPVGMERIKSRPISSTCG
jgi:hypothetical protein